MPFKCPEVKNRTKMFTHSSIFLRVRKLNCKFIWVSHVWNIVVKIPPGTQTTRERCVFSQGRFEFSKITLQESLLEISYYL